MSKTNYSKVEKALENGLAKMTSQQLWELADTSQAKTKSLLPPLEITTAIIQSMDRDLKKMHKQDTNVYKKIGFHRQNLKKLIADPSLLTPEDWKEIQAIRQRIEKYKKELSAQIPHLSNDEIIEQQRTKHVNKRFNINDKWLPLK